MTKKQMNSELLDKILKDDMISLSGGEFDVDLLGPDLGLGLEEDLDTTKPYSIIDKLLDGPLTHHTKYQHFRNTITSTIFSTVSQPLSIMTTTTTHSTINTTSPTPAISHNDTRQNTISAHTPITTTTDKSPTIPILKTLRQHTTYCHHTIHLNITTTMHNPKNISTNYSKPTIHNYVKTQNYTPKQTVSPSEHLPFTFCFIPNCPNYISKLNLPMNLARLRTEIQRNAELSIIKIVWDYLMKHNKHKNGNKNKTRNKKVLNYKPRFTSREQTPTSSIFTSPPTDTTTATQNPHPRFKQHTSTTTTHTLNQPIKTKLLDALSPSCCHNTLLPFISNQTPTIH